MIRPSVSSESSCFGSTLTKYHSGQYLIEISRERLICEIESSSNRLLQLNAIDCSELAAIWNLLAMLSKNTSGVEAVEAFPRLGL